MNADFFDTTIGDQLTLQRGFDITKKEQVPGDVPVVSSGGVSSHHNEAKVEAPGVVLGRKGSLGTVFFLEENFWPHDTTLWVKDFKNNNPQYVYYFFLNMSEQLKRMDVGAANPALNRNHVHPIEIRWPLRPIQDKAVEVLSSLDKKIQRNNQINRTLEQMAQAIFKSWFVDFDPVKSKMAVHEADGSEEEVLLAAMQAISGKDANQLARQQAEQPEQYAELRTTAALFPATMQQSELGEVPEGWEVSQLGGCLDTLETGARPKGGVKGITDGVPSVGAENILGVGNYKYGKEKFVPHEFFDKLKRGVVEHLDCLLYKDGGKPGDFRPRVSMFGCEFPYDTFAINEHVFRMRSERLGQPFLYFQIGHERVLAELRHRGAKAAIPGINQKDVNTIWVVCPSPKVLRTFNNIIEGMISSILTRSKENLRLSDLRDALLPKLLSGELTLPEGEELCSQVAV